jgi:hypothetical protein
VLIGPRKGKTNELQQSEILQMLQTLPQAGGATPEGKAMAQAPIPGMPPAWRYASSSPNVRKHHGLVQAPWRSRTPPPY